MQDGASSLKTQLDQQKSVVENLISNSKVFVIIFIASSPSQTQQSCIFSNYWFITRLFGSFCLFWHVDFREQDSRSQV